MNNSPKLSVFVSGATGFIGQRLLYRLLLDKKTIPVAASRCFSVFNGLCRFASFDLNDLKCQPDLKGIEVVIHTAARVHIMNETADDALAEYRKVNVDGTLRLATRAAQDGVKRFIFISSIKVNGEETLPGKPFKADDTPAPVDPYGVSKYEAEQALWQLAMETQMEVVIIRPPLVYGPGVKANFLSLLRWLNKGTILPLGAVHNRRSMVAVGNLVDFVVTCIDHPAAANQTFLVSDGEDLSTSDLLRCLSSALGRRSRLIPVPGWLMKSVAIAMGRRALASRIFGSLQVDIKKNHALLGWVPPITLNRAMRQTAIHFQETLNKV